MPVTVNIRHLENKNVQLEGDLPVQELEFDPIDEVIHVREPLHYDLVVEHNGPALLVNGSLRLPLECECVRCLRPFQYHIVMEPYDALIPLEGDDKATISNDLIDLTPFLREDIILAFPQHPVCEAGCDGLPKALESKPSDNPAQGEKSAWDALNKLKF